VTALAKTESESVENEDKRWTWWQRQAKMAAGGYYRRQALMGISGIWQAKNRHGSEMAKISNENGDKPAKIVMKANSERRRK
jgi:hypothetical protein